MAAPAPRLWLALGLSLLLLLAVVTSVEGKKQSKKKPIKGPRRASMPKKKEVYSDISDMLEKTAETICVKAAKATKKYRKRYSEKCDMFTERVVEMSSRTGAQMIDALNITMGETMEVARQPGHWREMKKHLKEATGVLFSKKKVTESAVDEALMKNFNQWFLNVATKQDKSQPSITPDMAEKMAAQGINVPPGSDDEDDDEL